MEARADYQKKGAPFEYCNVISDPEALERMLLYTKGRQSVPVIVEGDKVIIGYAGGS